MCVEEFGRYSNFNFEFNSKTLTILMKTSWQDVMRNFAGIQTLTLNSTVKLFNILYKTFSWHGLRLFAGFQALTLNLTAKL